MIILAMSKIESCWALFNGIATKVQRNIGHVFVKMVLEIKCSQNMIKIAPLFMHPTIPRELSLFPVETSVLTAVRLWDVYHLRKIGLPTSIDYMVKNIWKECKLSGIRGVEWSPKEVPSLRVLCLQRMSRFNNAFTGDSRGPYTCCSLENLYPEKLAKAYAKWDKPTQNASEFAQSLAHMIPKALDRLYYLLGTRKYFGTHVFDRHDYRFEGVPMGSSSGARAGPRQTFPKDQVHPYVRVYSVTGKKAEQIEYAIDSYKEMVEQAERGEVDLHDHGWIFSVKAETFNSSEEISDDDFRAIHDKARLFKIGFVTGIILEAHVSKLRMMLERGHIRVGMTWWWGGAEDFAKFIRYDDPDMVWSDADIRNLDMSLHRVIMEIYMGMSGVYYKFEPGDINTTVYKNLLKTAIRYLTVRVTHFFKSIWRVIVGGMPSGALNTSHGDSWCMLFLFCLFIQYLWETKPDFRRILDKEFYAGRVVFPIYGDDHIIGNPKTIAHYVNEYEFGQWLAKFWGMQIRALRMNLTALSVPNVLTGELSHRGVIFLQRFLIKRPAHFTMTEDMPDVYPYRALHKPAWRVAFSSDGESRDCVSTMIACIGGAYDMMGTNLVGHEFFQFLFQTIKHLENLDTVTLRNQMREKLAAEGKDIVKMLRKGCIPPEEILAGFPSIAKLESMHKRDASKIKFRQYDINHINLHN